MDFSELDICHKSTIDSILGSTHERFFEQFWSKKTHLFRDCLPSLKGFYDSNKFIEDYKRLQYHAVTLLVSVKDKKRLTQFPSSFDLVEERLSEDDSMVFSPLYLPDSYDDLPYEWNWFLSFYHVFCRYALPGFPTKNHWSWISSGPDFFHTLGSSQIGGHYDKGDVLYFVLEGEKEWTVELQPDYMNANKLMTMGDLTGQDLSPINEVDTYILKPGDCLYIPAFTYHRVRSSGKSLAVSVGLPNFSESSLIKYLMAQSELPLVPFPNYPASMQDLHYSALQERNVRMKAVLGKFESLLY
ncbi:hypothetical protein CSB62_20925 [Vibrio splendidus]|uniref:JmjC domain-containing protein n=1 Tax=Vibrio lentus TaxID=136468 RepID=A0A4U2FG26_9VIBR|nr:cupin domain-containing protein [Vibrio lentus]PHN84036.1 hypothetical protein CSB62_20925 [Vibrio splendidus]MCC4783979.1 cupin domain-containing protein [Vibrio lentus]MCC4854258.1 cupin domain-containing protein [Vibrio lentus]PME62476.1 hypothetical protein BCV33_03915 [Vibrio lentus]PMG56731.1 hypothetical protein BCU87_22920 [Vibrio lentus]